MSRTTRWHRGSARLTRLLSSIGCALLVLLSVAVTSTFARTDGSPDEGPSFTSRQLSASLVPPAGDELLGGEQSRLARAAERSNPVAVQRRAASRSEFEDPSSKQAISETNHAFPALLARTAGGTPQLTAGERIVRYPTSNAAQISLPGRVGVIEAIEPIAGRGSHGAHVPFDLSLARAGNFYAPVRSPVELSVPSALSHGVALPEAGVSLVPVDRRGAALAASAGQPDGAGVLWNVADGDGVSDLAAVAKASLRGFDLSTLLFSQRSPSQLYFRAGMPAGARLEQKPDGSVWIVKRTETIAVISPVSAEDAEGTSVPVSVNVSGNVISVHVDTTGDYLYPIAVDPEVNDAQLAKTTAGKRSNWEFHTNSAHFSNIESNGGPGAELLETKASGGYGTNEWGFWGYQTKGVSHIYEIKTETSAHNAGASVESFLEFEEAPPVGTLFGILETKTILSTKSINPEYEHKAATLCAANASKVEQCLPGSGKPNNAVHFQQSTTASSGTGFSDAMTQGIVSIAEPTGTHSTTGYNTTSPTLKFEAELEGKKVEVTRANALYGSGNWLTQSAGAIAPVASDAGIGVDATKLEYESSAGHWSQLFEHNYLGVESACQGVQCYVSHEEDATLPVGLPDGEDTLRYRAEEAISGTQSLESEGHAKVKVDTKAPYNLQIEGLPPGDELTERAYELAVEASDGEGSTVPSSGVKSIALLVDGHEVGTPTGNCSVAQGQCTATRKVSVNGAELGAGKHDIEIIALDRAGNEAHTYQPITIKHSTPVALGPGSLDLQSGDFALGATDVSLGSGLTVARNYSSRGVFAGDEGPLGPQWTMNLGNAESLTEIIDGAVMLTDANGRQVLFASTKGGTFEAPTGDSNLVLKLEENKTTKEKLAYYLEDPSAHTKTKFTLPSGGGQLWVPSAQEGAVGADTVGYKYQTVKQVTEYPLGAETAPTTIVKGPDENLWFPESGGSAATGKIGMITPAGVVKQFPVRTGYKPSDLTFANDEIAYIDSGDSWLWKMSLTGEESSSGIKLPEKAAGITGDGGTLWFTQTATGKVGYITDSGPDATYLTLPAGSEPLGITSGPEGNVWFGEKGKIGELIAGGISEFALPAGSSANHIVSGPDGNLWFTDLSAGKVGKITTTGVVTEYALPAGSKPEQIAPGPEGDLWFTDGASGKVRRITTSGVIVGEYTMPWGTGTAGIASESDGKLWFTQNTSSGQIGTMTPTGTITEPIEMWSAGSSGASCETTVVKGCRVLKFSYAAATTATGENESEWGEYKGRLTGIKFEAYDPVSKAIQSSSVASYTYDKFGRLRAEYDPRISPALKTRYGYDEEGHLTALSPPGQEPWTFSYGSIAGDSGTGRLLKAYRAPASTALWKGEALTNTVVPEITGGPTEGITMSAWHGTWTGSPISYSYQWSNCYKSGVCRPIPGATNPTYKVTRQDYATSIMVTVRATNAGGSVGANSALTGPVHSQEDSVAEYELPASSEPRSIALGEEARVLWFTEPGTQKLGKVKISGETDTFTEYPLTGKGTPFGIAQEYEKTANEWFTLYSTGELGKISPTGTITTYPITAGSAPESIALGHDHNLWFTESGTSKIGKIEPATGAKTEYALPARSEPREITAGPDGNLWFTEYGTGKVGKITTAGVITEYALATCITPRGITSGGGDLWFTCQHKGIAAELVEMTTAGVMTHYVLPTAVEMEFVTYARGELWVTGKGTNRIFRVSTSGKFDEIVLWAGSEPQQMVERSAIEMWIVMANDKIGKLNPENLVEGGSRAPEPGITINYAVPLSGAGAPAQVSAAEVAKWGQSDDPVEATSITPPDEPQSWPASSYKRATTYYLDTQGRQVNVAAPSSAPKGSISTTEYNEFNDPIRSLTPRNRQTALEAGAASVEKSKLLDTQNTYNGEGPKEGEVAEPGSRLIDSVGPQHKVTYVAGHEQKESLARLHTKLFYDEGAPGGESYDLQTKKTTLAQLSNEEEVEVRTTKTSYSGQSNLGWKLRAPTSVATYGPEEAALSKSSTEYNPTTGQVTEARGTSAESTLSYAKKFGEAGTEAGKLKAPWGTVVNAEGQILVVDSANNRIEKFSSEGTYVSAFGTLGSGNGQLKEPQGIALDSTGNVWVADTGNNRIEEFSSAGAFLKTVGSLGTESGKLKAPSDLAFDPKGNLWVADTANSRVEKFNKEGVYVSEFASLGTEPGKLKEPKGIAIDSGEHVWIADTANNRIEEFSATGSLLRRFGSPGSGEGQLNAPIDLKIDAQGNIWTADSKNNRAESFSPTGSYVTQIGYLGTANGQLSEPKGIAFDATGKAWVTDSANNRLQQWAKGPNAHDHKTIYYSTAANGEYPACGGHAEYAGLTCETLPAKQPELLGLPQLPVTSYTYNMLDEPETITETFGSSSRVRKETYDSGGRRTASETTATSGKSLPQVTFTYNSEQGVLEKQTAEGKVLASEFNRLGQMVKYSDADGNVAKYVYAGPENDYLLTEASDSSSGGTSKQTYEYDPTTKVATKLIDSAAGTFTATHDVEGKLTSVSYPYSMCALYAYNSIGETTSLQYTKSSNCSESEPGVFYQDSDSSSVRGEMLTQSSTVASDTYTYDPSGRLTESQETPAGEGCTVRAYSYDEEANRATSSTRAPGAGGVCQTEGGTVESHNYDEGNRLADGGAAYDAYGNVTKLPAADAEGHELTSSFYVDNAVATQTQSGVTNEYKLDPEGRTRELISGTIKTINHYDGPGEAVAWSETPEKWVRNIAGVDGTLLATQTNGETPVLQLHDLQGNVVATIGDKAGETKLLTTYNSSEFGVPKAGKAPPKFAYLGAVGLESSFSSGVITYGATSYVPQTGRALQSEAVEAPGLPGGSGAGAPYTSQEEPWNMQGAAREAAEAPGLEAAREQAALEAAEKAASTTIVDPWSAPQFYNLKEAESKAESFFEAESTAVVLSMFDLPSEFLELLGKLTGDAVSQFDDAYKWLYDAGEKLMKCAHNNRGLHHCRFEYDENEISGNFFGVQLFEPITWPNFTVEPLVYECKFFPNGSHECPNEVHINTEL
jgi:streptogramin lyase